jgi:hypothetical protein
MGLRLFFTGAVVLVCIAVPWVLPVLAPLLIAFAFVRKRYIVTSREIKRFDAITRSPIYASFGATLKVRAHSLWSQCAQYPCGNEESLSRKPNWVLNALRAYQP